MLILGSIFIALGRREERKILVAALPQSKIANSVISAAANTRTWHYKGGTGTFFKAATLPVLARTSARNSSIIHVTAQINDPRSPSLCQSYAEMQWRNKGDSPIKGVGWTADLARRQSLATILSVFIYAEEESRLRFSIFLCKQISHFRYDMSDSVLIVTREQPGAPAIMYSPGYFYESYRSELELSCTQGHKICIPENLKIKREALEAVQARQLLDAIHMQGNWTTEDYLQAACYARSPTSNFL